MASARSRTRTLDPDARWAAIREELAANAGWLATQGVLAPRVVAGRRVWSIRFVVREDGRKVHRAVYVGGDDQPELLERARGELEKYRARARWPGEVAAYARLAASASGFIHRTLGIQPRIRNRTPMRRHLPVPVFEG